MRADLKNRLLEGEALFLQGSYAEALEAFEVVLREDPENPYALNDAGLAYAEVGRIDRAVECFEKALQVNSACQEAVLNLIDVLVNKGFFDLAKEAFLRYQDAINDEEDKIKYKNWLLDKRVYLKESTKIIIILGMHRSGTSTVSKIVNTLGVYLGKDNELLEAEPDNPKGFWENKFFINLNDEILRRLNIENHNCTWCDPPVLYEGWEESKMFDDLKILAIDYINKNFRHYDLWGWKDPRTCLTLPFWRSILPGQQIKCVICLRNPLSVAKSLQKRNGFAIDRGLKLWFEHNVMVLKNTMEFSKIIINYEDIVDSEKRKHQIDKICEFIGVNKDVDWDAIDRFVEEELHHHKTDLKEFLEGRVNFAVKSLYMAMYSTSKQKNLSQNEILDLWSKIF